MKILHLFHSRTLLPEQLNEKNQIVDRRILGRDRFKFGIGSIMYQSEEVGLTPLHTLLIRILGGNDVHIGLVGGAGSLSSLVQWLGAVFLKKSRSNRIAMNYALGLGVLFGLIMAGALFLRGMNQITTITAIAIYLIGAYGLAAASGIQMNIESSWIGDLVPSNMLGWFTSMKWIVASLGMLFFTLLFGQVADYRPEASTFAFLFLFVAVSHVTAIFVMSTVTDRIPQSTKTRQSDMGEQERINYRSPVLWYYNWFYLTWAGGRTALMTFSTAYMLDLGFSMTKITLIIGLQVAINLGMLLIMGRITDHFGARLPLILISGGIAVSMLLWVASAWWGLVALIVYQVINGAAGNTHSMLAINYGLEIFPAKGRAAYIGFSRAFTGLSALGASIVSGIIMDSFSGCRITVGNITFNHYHIFFLGCTLFTASCIIPLLLAGKNVVHNYKIDSKNKYV